MPGPAAVGIRSSLSRSLAFARRQNARTGDRRLCFITNPPYLTGSSRSGSGTRVLVQFLVFVAVMAALLYGPKFLARTGPEERARLGKSAGGVGALVAALVLFGKGQIELALAVGGFGLYLLGYLSNHKWADILRGGPERAPDAAEVPGGQGGVARAGAMTEDEAFAVLGLGKSATRDEILAAHRNLMKKLHPDHGGTSSLAARVNAAREVLIRRFG